MSESKRSSGYYARIMGTFWRHPRTSGLSLAARGLWVSLLSWCADQRSDGEVPAHVVQMVSAGDKRADVYREELERAGLLATARENVLQLRDWSQHNITRQGHDEYKERKRNAMATRRAGSTDVTPPVTGNTPGTDQAVTGNPHVHVLSLSSDQKSEREGGAGGNRRPRVPEADAASLTSRAEAVRTRLVAAYKANGVRPPARDLSVPHSRAVLDVTRTLSDDGKLNEPDLDRLIAGFFKSERARSAGYPIAFLATNPAEYLAPAPNSPAAALPWDLHDIERLALSAAGEGRQWAATSKLERAWQGLLERHPALMAGRKHPGYLPTKKAAA